MNSYAVSEIKPDTHFNADLILDKNFILNSKICSVSQELIRALLDWDFKEVLSEGTVGIIATQEEIIKQQEEAQYTEVSFEEAMASAANQKAPTIIAGQNAAIKEAIEKAKSEVKGDSEKSRFEIVETVYNEYLKYINNVYNHYATHKEFDINDISETVKELCVYIKENKRYILRVTPQTSPNGKDFLVIHSMRTLVLAITIALQLRMPMSKMVELGVAALLHEIGMIRLPPQLYINDKPLNVGEKAKLSTHPIISYNILKDAGFPLSIQLGVLEHHERENGTGYPRHLAGAHISMYAKIISVACSFEAITTPRKYKQEHTAYEAMVEMLKNVNHPYDDSIVKALLVSLSLFPIGTYVYLSNGKIAQVSDVQPTNPKNPIVTILGESEADGSPKTIQTNDTDMKIARVMNKNEVADVLKALEAQKKK